MMPVKILVVDDHPETLSMLELILERKGFQVIATQSPQESLEIAESVRPELILLDVMMPELDGYEVCRRLRSKPEFAHTPILMFTAAGQAAAKWKGFETGADDYLTKPTDPTELVHRIETLLERADVRLAAAREEIRQPAVERQGDDGLSALAPSERVKPSGSDGTLIAVLGARGGAGTTTAAINLASALAEAGQQTILVDLDMVQGHVAKYLNQKPRYSLNDLAQHTGRAMTLEWRRHALRVGRHLQLLVARENLDRQLPELSAEQVATLMDALLNDRQCVVVDTGRGLHPACLPVVQRGRQVIVCTKPERVAIVAGKKLLALVNRHSAAGGQLSAMILAVARDIRMPSSAVEEFLGFPLLASVYVNGHEMDQSVSQSVPLVSLLPDSKVAQEFRRMAKALASERVIG